MSLLPVGISGEAQYQIERSLRFNSADSAYLNRTFGNPTNNKIWNYSLWYKPSSVTTLQQLISYYVNSVENEYFYITSGTLVYQYDNGTAYVLNSVPVFRDPSAWYHIVLAVDTTQATAANRIKVWVNNQQVAFSGTYLPQNTNTYINSNGRVINIGRRSDSTHYLSGYLTEINFIDGSALDPTSFGEFNATTGVWQPKAYEGSYGTNGFYLNFSDNSSTSALGTDYSGNSNTWSVNGISVTAGVDNDSLVDTPTPYGTDTGVGGEVRGNYATLNPIGSSAPSTITITDGNLRATTPAASPSNFFKCGATISVSTGKWYFEDTVTALNTNNWVISISGNPPIQDSSNQNGLATGEVSYFAKTASFEEIYVNGSATFTGSVAASANDVIGVAFDADARTIQFYRNNSAVSTAQTINLASTYYISCLVRNNTTASVHNINFGQRPFAYTAPSGFKALCTQNLDATQVATIPNGGDYFNAVLYTGTGSTQSITGVGFQPDFVWCKSRSSGVTNHALFDAVRGADLWLGSNLTNAEINGSGTFLTAFNSDGFSVGSGAVVNTNAGTYVGWNWKANGAGVSNTAGTITSTVSANTDSGFSIVTYTGTGSAATVGHGLGVAPRMVIVKNRDGAYNWGVYFNGFGAAYLDLTDGFDAGGRYTSYFNGTAPTSSVFSLGTSLGSNRSGDSHVAYCFAAIPGYSAFGSYTGNGSADGPFVYTGFRPAFVMVKRTDSTGSWIIHDTSRDIYNITSKDLYANLSDAETTASGTYRYDFLANGFKLRVITTNVNASGGTYIYMAFAENPFKYSLAR